MMMMMKKMKMIIDDDDDDDYYYYYYYSVPESGIRSPAEENKDPPIIPDSRDKVMQLFNAGLLRQVTT